MNTFLTLFIIPVLLTSCSIPKDYPKLADVPPYVHPSISVSQARKEIMELKLERGIIPAPEKKSQSTP